MGAPVLMKTQHARCLKCGVAYRWRIPVFGHTLKRLEYARCRHCRMKLNRCMQVTYTKVSPSNRYDEPLWAVGNGR